jgi:tRNA (guanine37-N1)-methyltransferase
MKIHVITLFPGMFRGPFEESIIGRASDRGLVEVNIVDLREFGVGKHKLTDDIVYGGGAGMLLKPEPLVSAVESITLHSDEESPRPAWVVLTSARGRLFNQQIAAELCSHSELIVICGRYEGVDERVSQFVVDDEISIGDYVLTGGEIAATAIVDATVRLLPGVVGSAKSLDDESHSRELLEQPQYTRPAVYRDVEVPSVLLSGHHAEIARWRREQSILTTARRRPDLLARANLSDSERAIAEEAFESPGEEA